MNATSISDSVISYIIPASLTEGGLYTLKLVTKISNVTSNALTADLHIICPSYATPLHYICDRTQLQIPGADMLTAYQPDYNLMRIEWYDENATVHQSQVFEWAQHEPYIGAGSCYRLQLLDYIKDWANYDPNYDHDVDVNNKGKGLFEVLSQYKQGTTLRILICYSHAGVSVRNNIYRVKLMDLGTGQQPTGVTYPGPISVVHPQTSEIDFHVPEGFAITKIEYPSANNPIYSYNGPFESYANSNGLYDKIYPFVDVTTNPGKLNNFQVLSRTANLQFKVTSVLESSINPADQWFCAEGTCAITPANLAINNCYAIPVPTISQTVIACSGGQAAITLGNVPIPTLNPYFWVTKSGQTIPIFTSTDMVANKAYGIPNATTGTYYLNYDTRVWDGQNLNPSGCTVNSTPFDLQTNTQSNLPDPVITQTKFGCPGGSSINATFSVTVNLPGNQKAVISILAIIPPSTTPTTLIDHQEFIASTTFSLNGLLRGTQLTLLSNILIEDINNPGQFLPSGCDDASKPIPLLFAPEVVTWPTDYNPGTALLTAFDLCRDGIRDLGYWAVDNQEILVDPALKVTWSGQGTYYSTTSVTAPIFSPGQFFDTNPLQDLTIQAHFCDATKDVHVNIHACDIELYMPCTTKYAITSSNLGNVYLPGHDISFPTISVRGADFDLNDNSNFQIQTYFAQDLSKGSTIPAWQPFLINIRDGFDFNTKYLSLGGQVNQSPDVIGGIKGRINSEAQISFELYGNTIKRIVSLTNGFENNENFELGTEVYFTFTSDNYD